MLQMHCETNYTNAEGVGNSRLARQTRSCASCSRLEAATYELPVTRAQTGVSLFRRADFDIFSEVRCWSYEYSAMPIKGRRTIRSAMRPSDRRAWRGVSARSKPPAQRRLARSPRLQRFPGPSA